MEKNIIKDNGENSALPHSDHTAVSTDPRASPVCGHCAPKVQRLLGPSSCLQEANRLAVGGERDTSTGNINTSIITSIIISAPRVQ